MIAGWGVSARCCRHDDRNEAFHTSGAGDTRNPPIRERPSPVVKTRLGRMGAAAWVYAGRRAPCAIGLPVVDVQHGLQGLAVGGPERLALVVGGGQQHRGPCRLQRPDAGTIDASPAALMPQRDLLLPWLTALDNAALAEHALILQDVGRHTPDRASG